jgi:hypothetical protein
MARPAQDAQLRPGSRPAAIIPSRPGILLRSKAASRLPFLYHRPLFARRQPAPPVLVRIGQAHSSAAAPESVIGSRPPPQPLRSAQAIRRRKAPFSAFRESPFRARPAIATGPIRPVSFVIFRLISFSHYRPSPSSPPFPGDPASGLPLSPNRPLRGGNGRSRVLAALRPAPFAVSRFRARSSASAIGHL